MGFFYMKKLVVQTLQDTWGISMPCIMYCPIAAINFWMPTMIILNQHLLKYFFKPQKNQKERTDPYSVSGNLTGIF